MHDLLNLPMPIDILFEVIRNRGWEITVVEENWDLAPALIAIADRRNNSIHVNGSKAPDLQAIAVTAIAHLGTGSFYDTMDPSDYPAFYEENVAHMWDSERGLIKAYWRDIQTVLAATQKQKKCEATTETPKGIRAIIAPLPA